MRKYFFYFSLVLILTLGCSNRNETSLAEETSKEEIGASDNYHEHPLHDYFEDCVQTIIKSETIDDKYILLNETTPLYHCYESLEPILPDSVWVDYTQHQSPVMRYYAFQALKKRNYDKISDIKMRLLQDTTRVTYRSGCSEIGIVRICDLIN